MSRLEAGLARGRRAAEKRMLTTCELQYEVGSTPDPETDADVPTYATAFVTRCRVKAAGLAVHQSSVGGRTSSDVTRELHIPALSADPWADPRSKRGVTALIIAVSPTDDPTLLGRRVRLSGPAPGSQTTARRLEIKEVVT